MDRTLRGLCLDFASQSLNSVASGVRRYESERWSSSLAQAASQYGSVMGLAGHMQAAADLRAGLPRLEVQVRASTKF